MKKISRFEWLLHVHNKARAVPPDNLQGWDMREMIKV
jgi:hypothetical protein